MKYNLVEETLNNNVFYSVVILNSNFKGYHESMYLYHGFYETLKELYDEIEFHIKDTKYISENIKANFEESHMKFNPKTQKILFEFNEVKALKEFLEKNPELMI